MQEGTRLRTFLRKPVALILVGLLAGIMLAPVATQAASSINKLFNQLKPKMDARYVQKSQGGETQIQLPIGAGGPTDHNACGTTYSFFGPSCAVGFHGYDSVARIDLDTANYPSGAVFWLRRSTVVAENDILCLRLFNYNTQQEVANTEVCNTGIVGGDTEGWSGSIPFVPSTGPNAYGLQGKVSAGSSTDTKVGDARIVVTWPAP